MTNGREKSDSAMSHREADEQGGAIRCGAGGAKGGGRRECGPAKHAPGAGPGKPVTGAGPHTASRKAKEEGEVHCALPPSHHRPARGRLRRTQRGRRCRRGWPDMDGVQGGPRAQPRGPARTTPPRSVPGVAKPADIHDRSRTADSARSRSPLSKTRLVLELDPRIVQRATAAVLNATPGSQSGGFLGSRMDSGPDAVRSTRSRLGSPARK